MQPSQLWVFFFHYFTTLLASNPIITLIKYEIITFLAIFTLLAATRVYSTL